MPIPEKHSVVLQDHLSGTPRWLAFRRPVALIIARELPEVVTCLRRVEEYTARGFYAAGFVSYEASPAMDRALAAHPSRGIPLAWFGVYERPEALTLPTFDPSEFRCDDWHPSVSTDAYHNAIDRIKRSIKLGDTYQVNYTLRLRSAFHGDPWSLFLALNETQRGLYPAYINLGPLHVCSVSPELFFSLKAGELTCKPMKGTAKRGRNTSEDRQLAHWLHSSEKNRAENVMIVDMIRNDMGRLATVGSVSVTDLFRVEKYPSIFQMTSTVTSQVSSSVTRLFENLFPCASITGAPKVRTTHLIKELEPDPRGVYTGAIGYVSPAADCQFNVAIRTVVVDEQLNAAEYGVGSGIVWDSSAHDEYCECETKARVLFRRSLDFLLIESVLWTREGGFYLLDEHLKRLEDSAQYFDFNFSRDRLLNELHTATVGLPPGNRKIKISLSGAGEVRVESSQATSVRGSKVGVARRAITCPPHLLFHKTSYRKHHSDLLDELLIHQPHLFDAIAWTEGGLITESGMANVVIAQRGELFTPSADRGLLPGVFRHFLLQQGVIQERDLGLDDLMAADGAFLINSVRGWMPLDRSPGEDAWIIRSDFRFELPALAGQPEPSSVTAP